MTPRIKCKICKRPLPTLAKRHGDPFCSTKCCKQAYNVTDMALKVTKKITLFTKTATVSDVIGAS